MHKAFFPVMLVVPRREFTVAPRHDKKRPGGMNKKKRARMIMMPPLAEERACARLSATTK